MKLKAMRIYLANMLVFFLILPISSRANQRANVELQTYAETVTGVATEMVRVPAGKFLMGSPDSEEDRDTDEVQHQVSVSSFYMGKYEVTQTQWRAVARLPKVKIDLNPDPSYSKGDNLPVERVGSEEAIEFCDRLSKASGKTYRLPTEAEWEYACRAMTTGPQAGNLDSVAWYKNNSLHKTHPVGTKQPNGFGLYDMIGNVSEWCMDWHSRLLWGESKCGPKRTGYQFRIPGDSRRQLSRPRGIRARGEPPRARTRSPRRPLRLPPREDLITD
jgi:formylglycine-generating enzyme required for sulfatase activity